MTFTICLSANTLYYPKGGGHFWAYLNWVLGFKSNGCRVIWMEKLEISTSVEKSRELITELKIKLGPFGLADEIALWSSDGGIIPKEKLYNCLDTDYAAAMSDLILNQYYSMPLTVLSKFKRSALLDIDPGLLQMWWSKKLINVASHDFYFTIGETVGQKGARFPNGGVEWLYTPPCVSLDYWPNTSFEKNASFTTITHWYMKLWEDDNGELYSNDKRDGFLPFAELPKYSSAPLELALLFGPGDEEDEQMLLHNGWKLRNSHAVTATPADYQKYVQSSLGEFSCVKPSCIRLQNAWISDRTICFLASGKPCVIENTGSSKFLPSDKGLFRFHDMKEAIKSLTSVVSDYEKHASFARSLAEEYFDAKKVTKSVLERAM